MFGSIRSHGYSPLSCSKDTENAAQPSVHLTSWLVPRRVRAALFLALLLVLLLVISQYSTLPPRLRVIVPQSYNGSVIDAANSHEDARWSDFAYVQYVTDSNYLCNSLMILEALHRLGSKADRIMMYPLQWNVSENSEESKLLAQARDQYRTELIPIQVKTIDRGDPTWKDSYTKLLAFNQTQYKRVISLDSDAIVQDHMDELFLLPSSPVAMPRAYWIDQPFLSSQIVVIEPSNREWKRMEEAMTHENSGFDMDILNKLYVNSCIIIPHRRYDLITSEFRSENHEAFLGSNQAFDAKKTLEEAKFVHFSDWPVPKPWLQADESVMQKYQPKCVVTAESEDCTNRDIWLGFYEGYSERRQQICGRRWHKRVRRSKTFLPPIRPKYEPYVI